MAHSSAEPSNTTVSRSVQSQNAAFSMSVRLSGSSTVVTFARPPKAFRPIVGNSSSVQRPVGSGQMTIFVMSFLYLYHGVSEAEA